jgi:hypothetical protein
MSLTITTADFTGLLGDVIPFALADDDLPILNAVHLYWDGHQLHAQATDHRRIGWASWHPDDAPERDVQGDIFHQPGSGDPPWQILIPLADAAHLVKTYKLPPKEAVRVPLTLDIVFGRLTVERERDSGHPSITTEIDNRPGEFPDVRALLAKWDAAEAVQGLAFTAKLLADFAKVRPRGPLELKFTGDRTPVLVTIGERFVGAISPVRMSTD